MGKTKRLLAAVKRDLEKTNWDGVLLVLCVVMTFVVAMLPPDFI